MHCSFLTKAFDLPLLCLGADGTEDSYFLTSHYFPPSLGEVRKSPFCPTRIDKSWKLSIPVINTMLKTNSFPSQELICIHNPLAPNQFCIGLTTNTVHHLSNKFQIREATESVCIKRLGNVARVVLMLIIHSVIGQAGVLGWPDLQHMQFLWCKYFYPGQFQASSMMSLT